MTDLPDQPNHDAALLRAEQNFFEQAQAQHQHHTQQLSALQAQLAAEQGRLARDDTIQILRRQLAQARKKLAQPMDAWNTPWQLKFPRSPWFNWPRPRGTGACPRQLDALQQWQHLAQHSLKLQLKLLIKSLLRRLSNRLRWLILGRALAGSSHCWSL